MGEEHGRLEHPADRVQLDERTEAIGDEERLERDETEEARHGEQVACCRLLCVAVRFVVGHKMASVQVGEKCRDARPLDVAHARVNGDHKAFARQLADFISATNAQINFLV